MSINEWFLKVKDSMSKNRLTHVEALRLTKDQGPFYFANYIRTNFQQQNKNVIQ